MNVYERIKLFIKLLFSNEKELYSFCADLTGFCPRGIATYRQALTLRPANASAINGIVVGSGSGYSKREAHQHAAEAAMKNPKKTNNMKNVVLIGASGFVGTAILNELLNRGHTDSTCRILS